MYSSSPLGWLLGVLWYPGLSKAWISPFLRRETNGFSSMGFRYSIAQIRKGKERRESRKRKKKEFMIQDR